MITLEGPSRSRRVATGDPHTALAHGYATAFVACAACLLLATVVAAVTMPRSG